MKRYSSIIVVISLITVSILAGCDSVESNDTDSARISLSIAATNFGPAAKNGSSVAQIDRVRILLRTIQFHKRDDDDGAEGEEFRSDPMVIDLPLDGTPLEIAVADIPDGSYHKVSFRIHKPDAVEELPEGGEEFRIGESGNERFSVIVDGVVDAQDFQYRSSKSMQQKVDFEADLVIDENTGDVNVTLLVDVSTWFVDESETFLDPFNTSGSNTSAIDKSIRESFRIFKDKNKDGQPD